MGLIDKAAKRPVNKTAALVTGSGIHYEVESTGGSVEEDTIPHVNSDLTGTIRGRLTVVGREVEGKRLVCTCSCGIHVLRQRMAIRNERNTVDACARCRRGMKQRRFMEWKSTGKDRPLEEFV